jgi:hypothetical protein
MQDDPKQSALNDALVEAVKAGSLDRVQELLSYGSDPSFWGKPWGQTPLHHAAELGFEEIAETLLKAGADPDRTDFNGVKPLIVASLAGHHGIARLIRDCSFRRRGERTQQQLDRLGWSVGGREDEAVFMLAGTEEVDDPARIVELAATKAPAQTEIPFTSFEGWIKQIQVEQLQPIALEAVEAGFPLFYDLSMPPEKILAAIPEQHAGKPWHFSGQRTRRFAGDDALPRSRYYTLCKDENGHDDGTLVCEMFAYSHVARTGKIDLIDMADPSAPKRLAELGLETPINYSLLLVFLPGPDSGLSPYLMRAGLPQRTVAFPLPVQVFHERIDKVIDLRIPDTADWFARFISQAILEVHSPKTGNTSYLKCWPFRPPLENFGQLLPEMLTQEHGGGVLSVAAGALLRKAGANALVFPSARNDPFLRVKKDGEIRGYSGWNLVDYRDALPRKQLIVLNVDRSWATSVRIGPGFSLKKRSSRFPFFDSVNITYRDSGPRRGSFWVEGIVDVHALIREVELQSFYKNEVLPPWWMF